MNMRKLFFLAILLTISDYCFSQGGTCGTYISVSQNDLEKTITITPLSATQSLPQVNRDLSVFIYIVNDSNNVAGVSSSEIDGAFNLLNSYFSPISLRFHPCNIVYIDNYQFNNLVQDKNENDLTTQYASYNSINLYVVGKITDRYKNQIRGYSYMPADNKNFIFITKSNINTSEIGHQFGHFFNLYHTHETNFGSELVTDPANCSKTGDLCCDTEADPKLAGAVSQNCIYTGKLKDSNNQYYHPSVKNLMSFSNIECRCYYSPTQYLRMIYALNNLKKVLK